MGLFDKIFGKPKVSKELQLKTDGYFKTLTAYQPVFYNWNGKLYESEKVRSAIDARSRHIAKLKIEINGAAKPILQTKLKKKPNSFQTWYQFLYRLNTILDMQNTAFIVPVIDKFGDITGVFPVLPSQCSVIDYNGTPWLKYMFMNGQTAAIEMSMCGIMTKFQYHDDFFGETNNALNETMNLITLHNQGIKEAVKSSASYRFMAKINNFSKAEDLAKERKRFSSENLSAEAEGGGLLLFPNTYTDIQQIKTNPYTVDPQQKELIDKNVFDYFGVSEEIIQNKASRVVFESFFEGAIEPLAVQFKQVITNMVYSPYEQAFGNEVTFYSNKLQRLTVAEKMQAFDRGLFTINEAREERLGLPAMDGGDVIMPRGEYYGRDEINEGESEVNDNASEE